MPPLTHAAGQTRPHVADGRWLRPRAAWHAPTLRRVPSHRTADGFAWASPRGPTRDWIGGLPALLLLALAARMKPVATAATQGVGSGLLEELARSWQGVFPTLPFICTFLCASTPLCRCLNLNLLQQHFPWHFLPPKTYLILFPFSSLLRSLSSLRIVFLCWIEYRTPAGNALCGQRHRRPA